MNVRKRPLQTITNRAGGIGSAEEGGRVVKKRGTSTKSTATTLKEYLNTCFFSENDPGLLINWNDDMLVPFVAQAISPLVVNPRPPWLRPTLALTIIEFKDDITSHLRLVGGGSFGNVLIAPNNWLQYGNVRERLKEIELDPFIQECMAAVPVGSTLGTCAQINEKANVRGEPLGRVPPQAPNTRLILD